MFPSIPGSKRDRGNEPDDPTAAGLSSGRFTEAQLIMMTELIEWWSYRRGQDDASNPLASLIGGVDMKGTARTTGLTPATAVFDQPLSPKTNGEGSGYLIQAFGVPDPPVVGDVYSIVTLAHFYYISSAFLARDTQIARAPAATTSTEIRTTTDGSGNAVIQLVGVTAITIDWTINVIRLEL